MYHLKQLFYHQLNLLYLYQNKKILQGFVERNGNATIRVVSDLAEYTINAGIMRYVNKNQPYILDYNPGYEKLPPIYNRGTVNT